MSDRSLLHDSLNGRVTAAIIKAEHLPEGPEREMAFGAVGSLEEQLASITSVDSLEGQVARRGAVTAALSARDPLRAQVLANDYIAAGGPEEFLEQLRELLQESMKVTP